MHVRGYICPADLNLLSKRLVRPAGCGSQRRRAKLADTSLIRSFLMRLNGSLAPYAFCRLLSDTNTCACR